MAPMTGFTSALVTGAAGFIGSALTRRLTEQNIRTYCLVQSGRYTAGVFEQLKNAEVIEVPSSPGDAVRKALTGISAEVVFNLASYGVNPGEQDPETMFDANLHLLSRLMLITSQWPLKRFIHTGSCFEYGEPKERTPLSEEHPLRPLSLYGAAKAASVVYGAALAGRLGMPFVALRLFGVYGRGERPHRLIPYIINRLRNNEPVDLTPGEQVRDLLYIDDVVDAFMAAAVHDLIDPIRVYNVCSGIPVTVREVGDAVAGAMEKPGALLHWGERAYSPTEAMWLVGDGTRFRQATGWSQQISLRDGIERMLRNPDERHGGQKRTQHGIISPQDGADCSKRLDI